MKFELEEIKLTENVAHAQEEQYAVILGLFPKAPLGGLQLGLASLLVLITFTLCLITFTRG